MTTLPDSCRPAFTATITAMARVITDTRKRAAAALRTVLPVPAAPYDLGPWHCTGRPDDPHDPVQWEGTPHCWHCGREGKPGQAEAA